MTATALKALKGKHEKRIFSVIIRRCSECLFRHANDDVADGTGDVCTKNDDIYMDYLAFTGPGQFPKRCPLKKLRK